MKCPICKQNTLNKHQLEADLPAFKCSTCEGIWISATQYWNWVKDQKDAFTPPPFTTEAPVAMEEAAQIKQCPECKHLLRRYQVWPDVRFYLDHCGTCDSVWFDKDEWSILKARNLHDHIRMFFSDTWQKQLRAEESRRHMDKMYQERFGQEDYARLKEIRHWLENHPKRELLLAYLVDKDPYKPVAE